MNVFQCIIKPQEFGGCVQNECFARAVHDGAGEVLEMSVHLIVGGKIQGPMPYDLEELAPLVKKIENLLRDFS